MRDQIARVFAATLAIGIGGCFGSAPADDGETEVGATTAALSHARGGDYYALRPDLRRCIAPLCGGVFVRRLNRHMTRCSDGSWQPECYVASLTSMSESPPAPGGPAAIVRGHIEQEFYSDFGELGRFVASDRWAPASDEAPSGAFYRVTGNGITCVTAPCEAWQANKLNSWYRRNIAEIDLSQVSASDQALAEAQVALASDDGLLVAATKKRVFGPGGRALGLTASQFYLPARTGGPTCEGFVCEVGNHCELQRVQCVTAPCPPVPYCVPDTGPTCADIECEPGTHCQPADVVCIRPPCPPMFECVPDASPK